MSIFSEPYAFNVMNDLAREREADAMVDLLKAFSKGITPEEFVATVGLAFAVLIVSKSHDQHTACKVSTHLGNYLHDATHSLYGGEPPVIPSPTVPDVGTA